MSRTIKLAYDTIDKGDIDALCQWLQQEPTPQLTKSSLTVEYEKQYAKNVGSRYAVFVNSGSSANLIAIYALIKKGMLKNKKIVIPALAWITTASPAIQFGLEPILCDVNESDLSVNLYDLEEIFCKENPSALFLVSVLGLTPNMAAISELCAKYGVVLLLDNCESQGSSINGRRIETFALMATCSSYFGHISSTIEGGMITTDNEDLYNTLKMLRSHGWTRDVSDEKQKELRKTHSVTKFNSLYRFFTDGFNVRNTEIGAFLGLRQLEKLDSFITIRDKNFRTYNRLIKNTFWMPQEVQGSIVSNLGYPLIHPKIDEIVEALRGHNIEVRPLISGNLGLHPFWIERYGRCNLTFANVADEYGCYLPNNASLTESEIEFVCSIVNRVINS